MLRRRLWSVGLTGAVALVLGVSSGVAAGEDIPPITTCGIPYTFTMPHGRTVRSGSCAGLLGYSAPRVSIRRGQTFSVLILHELSGRLDFPIPASSTKAVRRLGRTGATVTYRAVSRGVTVLVARRTRFCGGIDPQIGSCAVLRVRVR